MAKEAAHKHPSKHIITRAVGARDNIQIDFFSEKLSVGDLILLCSDGLSDMLDDNEISDILFSEKDIETQANELINAANENGGLDNITVVLIKYLSK